MIVYSSIKKEEIAKRIISSVASIVGLMYGMNGRKNEYTRDEYVGLI